jgi:hypothetical protein
MAKQKTQNSTTSDSVTAAHIGGRYGLGIALISLIGVLLAVAIPLCCRSDKPERKEQDKVATTESAPRPTTTDDAPMPPGSYPSVDEIADLPEKEQVAQSPKVAAEKVNFRYKNATGILTPHVSGNGRP